MERYVNLSAERDCGFLKVFCRGHPKAHAVSVIHDLFQLLASAPRHNNHLRVHYSFSILWYVSLLIRSLTEGTSHPLKETWMLLCIVQLDPISIKQQKMLQVSKIHRGVWQSQEDKD